MMRPTIQPKTTTTLRVVMMRRITLTLMRMRTRMRTTRMTMGVTGMTMTAPLLSLEPWKEEEVGHL